MIKANNKLAVVATSIALLTTPVIGPAKDVDAITLKQDAINHVTPSNIMQMIEIQTRINIENHKKAEAILKERERLQEIAKLKQERNNFFYIVKNKDITYVDLRTASGLTVEEANNILKGTGLQGLGEAFVEAEKNSEVNAYYLMAHAAWESKWGTSPLATNKNNLFGFTAYDASPNASATTFASKEECIKTVAAYIKDFYLDSDGRFHHGPNLNGMNIRYASDKNWARGIGGVMENLVAKTEKLDSNI